MQEYIRLFTLKDLTANHQTTSFLTLRTISWFIIIIIIEITFMQGIYNYTPETNHVSWVYRVVAVLYLQFEPQVMLIAREIRFVFLH